MFVVCDFILDNGRVHTSSAKHIVDNFLLKLLWFLFHFCNATESTTFSIIIQSFANFINQNVNADILTPERGSCKSPFGTPGIARKELFQNNYLKLSSRQLSAVSRQPSAFGGLAA